MQQHPKPVEGRVAAQPGSRKERRFQRRVDDVNGNGQSRQPVEPYIQRGLAVHAETSDIDGHGNAVKRIVAVLPG